MSRIHHLLEKLAAGTCSKEEFEELMQVLQTNENEEVIRSNLRKFYDSLDSEVISDVHIGEQGDMFQGGETDDRPRRVFRKRTLIAACTLSLVGIITFFFYPRP